MHNAAQRPSFFARRLRDNTPYLPLSTRDDDSSKALRLKPHIRHILRSKRAQYLSAAVTSLLLTLYLFFGSVTHTFFNNFTALSCPSDTLSIADCSAGNVDWSRFAYIQYVTNEDYLCNSLMIFSRLHQLGSRADRLMIYPSFMQRMLTSNTREGRLLRKAQKEFGVKLVAIEVQHHGVEGDLTWGDSYTKLLAFNQTQYNRVLSLDSDSTVLQSMDELFLLPATPIAMPRAYWMDQPTLSSQLFLVQPSTQEFARVQKAVIAAPSGAYDMEILNGLYGNDAMVIPHRRYNLLTSEFKNGAGNHSRYLGNDYEKWDSKKILLEAKFLHFSDWPAPKPWMIHPKEKLYEYGPKCVKNDDSEDCSAKDFWVGLYDDFLSRRKEICGFVGNIY